MKNEPRYPAIHVPVVGHDGNAFAILGRVIAALRDGSVSDGEIEQFRKEATSSDYDHLLRTCAEWVWVEVG